MGPRLPAERGRTDAARRDGGAAFPVKPDSRGAAGLPLGDPSRATGRPRLVSL